MADLKLREQAVWDEVLTPMTALYSLPKGKDESTVDTALAEYVHELKRFTADELSKGWASIRGSWNKGFWPPPPELSKACQLAKQSQHTHNPDFDRDYDFAWNVGEKSRLYIDKFMKGGLGLQSIEEQWDHWLRDFVWKIAHYQAQIVARAEQCGYASYRISRESWRRESYCLDAFERENGLCAEVPSENIEKWRTGARRILENGGWDRQLHGRSAIHPQMRAAAPRTVAQSLPTVSRAQDAPVAGDGAYSELNPPPRTMPPEDEAAFEPF